MDYKEFKAIVTEVGYTELEAEWLWAAKPKEQEIEAISIMFAALKGLPELCVLRKKPDHEERVRQRIAVLNGS